MSRGHRWWVVRVVHFTHDRSDLPLWLEQLRYAGLITWHRRDVPVEDDRFKQVFDLHAPAGHTSEAATRAWAEQKAARMRSFNLNAQPCPAMDEVRDA